MDYVLLTKSFNIYGIGDKKSKKVLLHPNISPSFYSIYSGSADYASGLRVIGGLLLGLNGSFAHYRTAHWG